MSIKRKYPPGTKIRCISMNDEIHPVPSETIGTVLYVDDANTIHMAWQTGSSLGLLEDVDDFEIIEE